MQCSGCHGESEPLDLKSHVGLKVTIDACWSCQLIWFDHLESASLSAGSVIELFKRIHAARDSTRNLVPIQTKCPRCASLLESTSDIAKGGRFVYSRCPHGHGRLIAFTQFLREKNFIRSLQPYEISALAVKIHQIRCSSCGGPINLETDKACTHCGSAISVLDEAAVDKALAGLHAKEAERVSPSPDRIADAVLSAEREKQRLKRMNLQNVSTSGAWLDDASPIVDLVEAGVSALLSALSND